MNVRPGPVRDRIGEFVGGWMGAIEGAIREAQSLGEISAEANPTELAFETNAMLIAANLCSRPAIPDRSGRASVCASACAAA